VGRTDPLEGRRGLDRTSTEGLIALLHAQRDEAGWRAGLTRDTPAWTASCERLDVLNDRIMHDGARAPAAREPDDPGPTGLPMLVEHVGVRFVGGGPISFPFRNLEPLP
jgi:hypothetical protein